MQQWEWGQWGTSAPAQVSEEAGLDLGGHRCAQVWVGFGGHSQDSGWVGISQDSSRGLGLSDGHQLLGEWIKADCVGPEVPLTLTLEMSRRLWASRVWV